eukprot:g68472.t1
MRVIKTELIACNTYIIPDLYGLQAKAMRIILAIIFFHCRAKCKTLWSDFFPNDYKNITADWHYNVTNLSFFDPLLIDGLRSSHFRYPVQNLQGFVEKNLVTRYADFYDVKLFGNGVVSSRNLSFIHGACFLPKPITNPNLHCDKVVDEIVSTAWAGSTAIYHFPGESLPIISLAFDLYPKRNFHIHVEGSNYVKEWLKIAFPSFPDDRIITGPICAKRMLAIQAVCGAAGVATQMSLRRRLLDNLKSEKPILSSENPILVSRSSRTYKNWNTLFSSSGFSYEHHADHHLGSLNTQLRRFAERSMVIAPHGAGLVLMIVSPPSTCIFEFHKGYTHENLCFWNLAMNLGLRYFGFSVKEEDFNSSHVDFVNSLRSSCLRIQ